MEHLLLIPTPVGEMGITATDDAVTRIFFNRDQRPARPAAHKATAASGTPDNATPLLLQAARELTEYFAGTRRTFSFPMTPAGTPFQQAVWAALQTIPYGQTRSYKQIAQQIGRPAACRAVGMANNRNPIALAIPCHRVVGHGGALVGYAAGLEAKARLLRLEQQ